jgi:hypothetical protein
MGHPALPGSFSRNAAAKRNGPGFPGAIAISVVQHSVQSQYWIAWERSQVTKGDYLCILSLFEILLHRQENGPGGVPHISLVLRDKGGALNVHSSQTNLL